MQPQFITKVVSIFPNPVKDFLTIETKVPRKQTYQIYATTGKLLLFGQIDSNNKTIDLSTLSPNIYLLNMDGKTLKFIKL